MNRILITGAAGQIGSELVPVLRERYGDYNVIAADILKSGPCITIDVTERDQIDDAIKNHSIDTIFHLSSILSALAEQNRQTAYRVNFDATFNVLESAVEHGISQVIIPSSIGAFGPDTPPDNTPNETLQHPNTLYGISKVFSELMGNYYSEKLGLDVRGVRLPGIISWKTEPTAGTTDYAVAIFYGAIREKRYTCYLRPDTRLPMMYMTDAIKSLIDLAKADPADLKHQADYNVTAISFTPNEIAEALRARIPGFEIDYEIDPLRQAIADSWPNSLDDSAARTEWGWQPDFGLDAMVDDMLVNLERKLSSE